MTMAEKVMIGNAELWHGDAMDVLPQMADETFDAVITDPPYGIAYVTGWREKSATPAMLANDDNPPLWAVWMVARKMKEGAAMYLATRLDAAPDWMMAIDRAGLTKKTPIYWDKTNHTSGDLEGDWGGQVEIFLFSHKGRHLLRGKRHGNLWSMARPVAGEHPTPKPERLMERMVCGSTDRDGFVLDPFMGSGTTGIACANHGRRFVGIEIERKYFDMACERISRAQAQERLFA